MCVSQLSFVSFIYRDQCYNTLMRLLFELRQDDPDLPAVSLPSPSAAASAAVTADHTLDQDMPASTSAAGTPPAADMLAAALAALPPPPSASDDVHGASPPLSTLASLSLTSSDCDFIINTRMSSLSTYVQLILILDILLHLGRAEARLAQA